MNHKSYSGPLPFRAPASKSHPISSLRFQQRLLFENLGIPGNSPEERTHSLPFAGEDSTAGSETELQAAVKGNRQQVDLPLTIEQSDYLANILRRERSGEAPRKAVTELERFLYDNGTNIWENSWVRFQRRSLSAAAERVFMQDLWADKERQSAGLRHDAERFTLRVGGEEFLRVPISYLPKLALADLAAERKPSVPLLERIAQRLMAHFLSDNTSPETFSFHVVSSGPRQGLGRGLAGETAKRFLLTQLLIHYANEKFGLREAGQTALIYSAPHPPVRQKELSRIISDAFYRELFMSPCLSGWAKGEEKNRYMWLCHEVLSRSQLHAVHKLREAGIIANNLVVLPNVSNISLANNGTHVSLGSRRLTAAVKNTSGFGEAEEKVLGDLAIKIIEHFLPLFVGTYSAAPYRLGFSDFHPETVLSFLPHELDFTHLRMMWRRWKKKATISILGCPVTPFGPPWLDRSLGKICSLAGDFVPDFRLIDYPVALLSTSRHPSLDGALGNQQRLKNDLADLGIFDRRMSLYLLYRQRHFHQMGFSGFEGRYLSTFAGFTSDLEAAVNLQNLVTALAFKYMAEGRITHRHIPDNPTVESERRQVFFGTAIGLPTFFVGRGSRNHLLRRILQKTRTTRVSRRYPRFLRVRNLEYRRALLEILREDGADLIEMLKLEETLNDLERRLRNPEQYSCAARMTQGTLELLNAGSPLAVPAEEFNAGAERYYRDHLRRQQTAEALELLAGDVAALKSRSRKGDEELRRALNNLFPNGNEAAFVKEAGEAFGAGRLSLEETRRLIDLALLSVYADGLMENNAVEETNASRASVY
ncbi:MAG: hypothetical protein JXB25_09020 [Deltaproteobacteria bacterium]|nr:hypothetical protein [Deltaproteobacteria bacterium]